MSRKEVAVEPFAWHEEPQVRIWIEAFDQALIYLLLTVYLDSVLHF